MEDHVSLGVDSTFLPNDFDELTEREGAMTGPSSDANDQALLLERLWALALDQDLGQLAVVGDKDPIVVPQITV